MKRIGLLALLLTLTGCDIIRDIVTPGGGGAPQVVSTTPADGATNVAVGSSVVAALNLPNGGVNLTSVEPNSVRLVDAATGTPVAATVTPDNDALTLTLKPLEQLEFGTEYRFEVTSGVLDEDGQAFGDFSSTFTTVSSDVPSVISSEPADGATNVPLTVAISADINTSGGVAEASLTAESVYLVNLSDDSRIPGNAGTTGGGDGITFTPSQRLAPSTRYQFNVTSGVIDLEGNAFVPYTATFTTTSNGGGGLAAIAKVPQPTAARERHTSLTFGPDGLLYAATADGRILRYPVAADGSLGTPQTISTLVQAEGEPRLTIGLAFDPAATANNLILWVTHTVLGVFDGGVGNDVEEKWSGKLTRLSGPNLETLQDVVVGLPRSSKDHVTNSVAFNPAEPGVIYIVQGSNTAMGAPDSSWRFRPETVLSGAVLRLNTSSLGALPLNAQTEEGGTYNPYTPGAPLTIYATGTRNSYDLVWHSNGNLYIPANGSRQGGITPRYNPIPGTCERRGGYTGPILDSPTDVPDAEYVTASGRTDGWQIDQTLEDYLFKIEEGGYYGTPNPARCEWILNGGGAGLPGQPTTRVEQYPDTVAPDPNYRGPAGSFGEAISPNGAIEYKGNAFPALKGQLLVTRYSSYDDIVGVTFGADGNEVAQAPIIQTDPTFVDPLDIAESPITGYLYVSLFDELGGPEAPLAGITLLRPQ